MTKEPADWAKIKAYRMVAPATRYTDAGILNSWDLLRQAHELARMYDQYEQPDIDPDLLAAREWADKRVMPSGSPTWDLAVRGFLAGIKHGGANP